jgi:hypothetical protein
MSAGAPIPLETLGSSRVKTSGFSSSDADIASLKSTHDVQVQYNAHGPSQGGNGANGANGANGVNGHSLAEPNGDEGAQGEDDPRSTGSRPKESDLESPINYIEALPPVDGGCQAWSYLVAATILETLIWGIPYTVGIFHEYWTSTLFKGQGGEGVITLASTLQTGLMYMSTAAFGP